MLRFLRLDLILVLVITFKQCVFDFVAHIAQGFFGSFPIDTFIGNRYAVFHIVGNFLVACTNIAFNHNTDDGLVVLGYLVDCISITSGCGL